MDTEITKAVFRVWCGTDTVLALFPEIEARPGYCLSYERVGQHGGADYSGCIRRTRPAKPEEYASLKNELQSIGYKIRVLRRRPTR